jgi:hypothetical protein
MVWVTWLLEEMIGTQAETTWIMIDNLSATALSKNPVLHGRSKHIRMKYNFIRECVDRGAVVRESVGTIDLLTEILI